MGHPMLSMRVQKFIFAGTSRLTEHFPQAGSRFLDSFIYTLVGNTYLSAMMTHRNRTLVSNIKSFNRILIIPDTHIGDTIMMQAASSAVRDFFPAAHIDYVTNKTATPLVEGNPEISRLIPVFSGGLLPTQNDIKTLKELTRTGQYDLCINLCAYVQDKELNQPPKTILNVVTHSPTIIRNELDSTQVNHFLYQCNRFIRGLLATVAEPVREEKFLGVRTTFSDSAIERAILFAKEAGITPQKPVIMINPDTASRLTLLPFDSQAKLLNSVARMDATVLLGAGHTMEGIGNQLIETLPPSLRSKVKIVPAKMPLDVYSALIDFSDTFITCDTGPMHIAASRRYSRSGHFAFRNRTSVLSIFGATPPRMSGYDSNQPGYLPANQDAPSWSYTAGSTCRNISCLNKMFKTCETVRCFDTVDVEGLSQLVFSNLRPISQPLTVQLKPPSIYANANISI